MGTFKLNCIYCGTRVEVDDVYANSKANCPGCGRVIELIPEQTSPPPPPSQPLRPRPVYTDESAWQQPRAQPQLVNPAHYEPKEGLGVQFMDFLCFRRMIFPKLVIVLCAMAMTISIITGIVLLVQRQTASGIISLLLAPLAIRLFCELTMVFFSINETLTTISKKK